MNTHYLELLKELIRYPEIIMDEHHHVYKSELRVNKEVNHHLHATVAQNKSTSICLQVMICLLFPLIATGATAMEMKLRQYGRNHQPGGIYWDPIKV